MVARAGPDKIPPIPEDARAPRTPRPGHWPEVGQSLTPVTPSPEPHRAVWLWGASAIETFGLSPQRQRRPGGQTPVPSVPTSKDISCLNSSPEHPSFKILFLTSQHMSHCHLAERLRPSSFQNQLWRQNYYLVTMLSTRMCH